MPNRGTKLAALPWYRWVVVGVLFIVAFLNAVDRHAIYALFPLLEKDLGMSKVQLGMLGSAFLWAYAFMGLLAGYFGDRFPRRNVIMISCLGWSGMTALTGLAMSGTQLIVLRALLAITEAFFFPTALAAVAEHHTEATRSKAVALLVSAMSLGQVGGGFLAGYMAEHFSWRILFFCLGAAGVLYVPVLFLLLHPPAAQLAEAIKPKPQISFLRASRTLAQIPTLRFFAVAFMCYTTAGTVVQTWLPYYLFNTFHTSLTVAGFSAAFYWQVPTVFGNLVGGGIGDYFATRTFRGRMLVQAGSLAVSGLFFIGLGMAGSLPGVALSLVLLGLFRGGWPPNVMPVIFQVVPANLRATAYGFLNFLGSVSAGLSVIAAGALGGHVGFRGAFASCTLIYWIAVGMLIYTAFWRLKQDFVPEQAVIGSNTSSEKANR